MIRLDRLDHFVLTVKDIETTCEFYRDVLACEVITFGPQQRKALGFGIQKINLHQAGAEFEPKSLKPTPGSADLCFITQTPMDDVIAALQRASVEIEEGPVARTGAQNPLLSVYLRDPDGNLIEISNEV